jgi:hypothetical protein
MKVHFALLKRLLDHHTNVACRLQVLNRGMLTILPDDTRRAYWQFY